MKKIMMVLSLVLWVSPVFAETSREKVLLELPSDFEVQICPQPIWNHVKVVWKGVEDIRSNLEIGIQTKKKGEEPIIIDAEKPLIQIFEPALKTLLTRCGLDFVPFQAGNVLSVQIEGFYADVKKGFFTGKGKAESRLNFSIINKDAGITTLGVSTELNMKNLKRKEIKQVKMLLDDLLLQTLEQIPKSDLAKELK